MISLMLAFAVINKPRKGNICASALRASHIPDFGSFLFHSLLIIYTIYTTLSSGFTRETTNQRYHFTPFRFCLGNSSVQEL